MTAVHLASAELGDPIPTLNEEPEALPPALTLPRQANSSLIPSPSGSLHRSFFGGMRRWMGSANSLRTKSARDTEGKPTPEERAAGHVALHSTEKPAHEPTTLEAVVQRTLTPVISRAEAREYQAYCSQFDQVPFRCSYRATDADMQVYENASSLCNGVSEMIGHAQTRVEGSSAATVDHVYAAFTQHFQQPLSFVPSTSATLRVASH